jgi:hypothetical protein
MQSESPVQLVGQVALEPLHAKGRAQAGVPALPSARFVHVPLEQSPQGPQAVLQQTLDTQKPLPQSVPELHVLPSVRSHASTYAAPSCAFAPTACVTEPTMAVFPETETE